MNSFSRSLHEYRVDRQNDHQYQQNGHHELRRPLDPFLDPEHAHRESDHADQDGPEGHHRHVAHHFREGRRHFLGAGAVEITFDTLKTVIQKPSAYGGIEHHQKIASHDTDPFCPVPLRPLRRQLLKGSRHAEPAGTADGKLAYQDGDPHDQQKDQVDQNKCRPSIFPAKIREFPYISDPDGTPCGYQDEPDPGTECLSLHSSRLPSILEQQNRSPLRLLSATYLFYCKILILSR